MPPPAGLAVVDDVGSANQGNSARTGTPERFGKNAQALCYDGADPGMPLGACVMYNAGARRTRTARQPGANLPMDALLEPLTSHSALWMTLAILTVGILLLRRQTVQALQQISTAANAIKLVSVQLLRSLGLMEAGQRAGGRGVAPQPAGRPARGPRFARPDG
jgi:hypothetical protein